MPITLRRLTPADAPAYRRLALEGYERHPDAFTSTAGERAALPLAWWEQRTPEGERPSKLVLGAWDGDTLLGVCGLAFESAQKTSHKALLFGMVVDGSRHRSGVGRLLVQGVLDEAARRPVRVVQLTVTDGNEPAEALYRGCGFQRFGLEPMAVLQDGAFLAKAHMWCEVTPERPPVA